METNKNDRPLQEVKIVDSGKLTLKKPFTVPKSAAMLEDMLESSQVVEQLIQYEEGEYEREAEEEEYETEAEEEQELNHNSL